MTRRPFQQIDVFTDQPYRGNPLAVVLDAQGLSTQAMQQFTGWSNLSEASFLLPPTPQGQAAGADYRVRIFSPAGELPFAGHPTLGSCHAWLAAGGQPRAPGKVVQECGVGLVTLRQDHDRLAFAAPPLLRSGPLDEAEVVLIARGLGVARGDIVNHAWCDNGPQWRAVMLQGAEQVLAIEPDRLLLHGLKVGVVGASAAPGIAFEVRAFFPGAHGLIEDPVTGSLNAGLAQWLIGAGLAPPSYVAAQGTRLGRVGRVHVAQQGGTVWIGGHSVACVSGTVLL